MTNSRILVSNEYIFLYTYSYERRGKDDTTSIIFLCEEVHAHVIEHRFYIFLVKENNWFMTVLLSLVSICFFSFIYSDHVPVGGFCVLDKQCTGSNNSETCTDGRCRCSGRHILHDLECIQGICSKKIYDMIDILCNIWCVLKID